MAWLGVLPGVLHAQNVESVGSRALGMGGAFVAVADDSSATWWNPAGPAAGPLLDVAIARAITAADDRVPADRQGVWSFAAVTPPLGLSYYRFRITDIRAADPTEQERADREDLRAGALVRSLSVSQFGATILQTVLSGVHAGATVKYLRGTVRSSEIAGSAAALSVPDLLDRGDDLSGGDGEHGFDVDVGLLAVAGAFRVGGLVRNVREQEFGDVRLPRQVRVGAAFDGDASGMMPLMLALDADVRSYETASGDRRVIAVGAEHWLLARRVGIRGGARFNTVGARERAVTGGASYAARPGFYVDGHVVLGGADGESGWGMAARVSF